MSAALDTDTRPVYDLPAHAANEVQHRIDKANRRLWSVRVDHDSQG